VNRSKRAWQPPGIASSTLCDHIQPCLWRERCVMLDPSWAGARFCSALRCACICCCACRAAPTTVQHQPLTVHETEKASPGRAHHQDARLRGSPAAHAAGGQGASPQLQYSTLTMHAPPSPPNPTPNTQTHTPPANNRRTAIWASRRPGSARPTHASREMRRARASRSCAQSAQRRSTRAAPRWPRS
jgi:hypothetical protein